MENRATKVYWIVYFLTCSSLGGTFEVQNAVDSLGSALSLIQESAGDAVNQGTNELLNIPVALGDRLSCAPCSLISEFVMTKLDENVYIQSLMISTCPILFYGDWHKMWACEVLMVGSVVYSHFGSPTSLCRAMGMCPNLFRIKRNTDESHMDPGDLLEMLPLNFDDFSEKLADLDPSDQLRAQKLVYKIVARAGKQTPIEYTNSLRELAQFYR